MRLPIKVMWFLVYASLSLLLALFVALAISEVALFAGEGVELLFDWVGREFG